MLFIHKFSFAGAAVLAGLVFVTLPGLSARGEAAGDAPRVIQSWPDHAHGFASVAGDGRRTTTGGAGGREVVVRSQAELERYAKLDGPCVIRVKGDIQIKPLGKNITVTSDKTLIGIGADARIRHGELHLIRVSNIIIRNLTLSGTEVAGDWEGKTNDYDAIQMDYCDHIWIDHCRLERMGDGLIDSRHGTDYVTVSWNILDHHNKAFGIGWTDKTDFHMTIDHNWIHDTEQRNPSFDQGIGHLYNNYLQNITSYGNYSRGHARLVVENSYFENVVNPLQRGDDAELVTRGNSLKHCKGENDPKGQAFDPHRFYDYQLDDAASLPALLGRYAGPQPNIGR